MKFSIFITFSILLINNCLAARQDLIRGRIIGGQSPKPGKFTFLVSIRGLIDSETPVHFCGGAIISNNWIITAGHCVQHAVKSPEEIFIVAGAKSIDDDDEEWFGVKDIVVHPSMQTDGIRRVNDLALLKTDETIRFNGHMNPILIGRYYMPERVQGYISGWGFEKDGLPSSTLKYVRETLISNDECVKRHDIQNAEWILDTTLCTVPSRVDIGPSRGDSGTPLIANGLLVGVVSWMVPNSQNLPIQYTRISTFTGWINRVTGVIPI